MFKQSDDLLCPRDIYKLGVYPSDSSSSVLFSSISSLVLSHSRIYLSPSSHHPSSSISPPPLSSQTTTLCSIPSVIYTEPTTQITHTTKMYSMSKLALPALALIASVDAAPLLSGLTGSKATAGASASATADLKVFVDAFVSGL